MTNLFASDESQQLENVRQVATGMKNIIKALEDEIKVSFRVAKSIVAWNVPSCQAATKVDTQMVQVWTREFLEPTLSAFPFDQH